MLSATINSPIDASSDCFQPSNAPELWKKLDHLQKLLKKDPSNKDILRKLISYARYNDPEIMAGLLNLLNQTLKQGHNKLIFAAMATALWGSTLKKRPHFSLGLSSVPVNLLESLVGHLQKILSSEKIATQEQSIIDWEPLYSVLIATNACVNNLIAAGIADIREDLQQGCISILDQITTLNNLPSNILFLAKQTKHQMPALGHTDQENKISLQIDLSAIFHLDKENIAWLNEVTNTINLKTGKQTTVGTMEHGGVVNMISFLKLDGLLNNPLPGTKIYEQDFRTRLIDEMLLGSVVHDEWAAIKYKSIATLFKPLLFSQKSNEKESFHQIKQSLFIAFQSLRYIQLKNESFGQILTMIVHVCNEIPNGLDQEKILDDFVTENIKQLKYDCLLADSSSGQVARAKKRQNDIFALSLDYEQPWMTEAYAEQISQEVEKIYSTCQVKNSIKQDEFGCIEYIEYQAESPEIAEILIDTLRFFCNQLYQAETSVHSLQTQIELAEKAIEKQYLILSFVEALYAEKLPLIQWLLKNTDMTTTINDLLKQAILTFLMSRKFSEILKYLMKQWWSSITLKDPLGRTLLFNAFRKHLFGLVQWLLQEGYVNIADKDKSGMTALHHAAKEGPLELVQYLLTKGAKIEDKDQKRMTTLLYAVQRGDIKITQLLIDKGANLNEKDGSGSMALLYAIRRGDFAIVQLLINKETDIHEKDPNGKTPLLCAAKEGNLEIVQYLLTKGANIEDKDQEGMTTLLYAIKKNHLEMVKWLISEFPGCISQVDKKGNNALLLLAANLSLAEFGMEVDTDQNILQLHSYSLEGLQYLILETDIDVSHRNNQGQDLFAILPQHHHDEIQTLIRTAQVRRLKPARDRKEISDSEPPNSRPSEPSTGKQPHPISHHSSQLFQNPNKQISQIGKEPLEDSTLSNIKRTQTPHEKVKRSEESVAAATTVLRNI